RPGEAFGDGHYRNALVRVRVLCGKLSGQVIYGGFGLRQRHARLESRHDPQLVSVPLFEALWIDRAVYAWGLQGNIDVGPPGNLCSLNPRGGNTDQGYETPVEANGLTENAGVRAEFCAPARVVEHAHCGARLVWKKRAPAGGVDSKQREIVGRDGAYPNPFGL